MRSRPLLLSGLTLGSGSFGCQSWSVRSQSTFFSPDWRTVLVCGLRYSLMVGLQITPQ